VTLYRWKKNEVTTINKKNAKDKKTKQKTDELYKGCAFVKCILKAWNARVVLT
jgi:hypothetical protein